MMTVLPFRVLPKIQQHWGLLAAICVGLFAVWLTVAHGLPFGHDSTRHIYRLVERDYLIRHGLFFTRWSPFLGYGYGFPLYNYYQPLLDYLAEPFMLASFGPLLALRITLGLALIGAAVGVYLWVGDLFGSGPGVVAATAFLFSPYVMFTLINRAGFPEIVALAWMPWGLWLCRRYVDRFELAYGAAGAVVLAATLLSHLFSAYIFVATLLIYVCVLSFTKSQPNREVLACLFSLGWPVGLGLGLAAFFWLPAMVETDLIRIERMLEIADPSTGEGFMPLWQVFAGPILPDTLAPVATVPARLSGLTAGLALAGTVTGWAALHSPTLKVHLSVAVIVTMLTVLMLTPVARWIWQAVPMLRLGLFPFRFLGVASLWLALLAGAGAGALLASITLSMLWSRLIKGGIITGLCLVLALYSLNWPTVAYHASNIVTDLTAVAQYERTSKEMGLVALGEYLPKTVNEEPPAATGPGIDQARLATESLEADAHVIAAEYELLKYTVTIDSPRAFRAIFNTFYFPGWWAKIDGRRVPLTPTDPYGLISVAVPAGQQQIEIVFGSTPIRTIATGLSLLCVLALGALGIELVRRRLWQSG